MLPVGLPLGEKTRTIMTKQSSIGKPQWWDAAKRDLCKTDPIMASIINGVGEGFLESRGGPFETLLRSIVGQQISVKAAANIWERFVKACPILTPEAVSRKHRKTLRSVGLSERKIDFVLDVCRFFVEEKAFIESMDELDDEAIIEKLTTIRGVGRWTAEMFLIFTLNRPDVLPLVDFGFLEALRRAYFPEVNPEEWSAVNRNEEILKITSKWQPWRSAATWYLWRSLNNGPM